MIKVKRGIMPKPVKLVVYGPEGIGKTTLASKAPGVLFIDTEDGTKFIDCARVDPAPTNWKGLMSTIQEIAYSEGLCRTLVIDTADWAEKLAIAHVVEYNKVTSIEDISYGKGYTMVGEVFKELLNALDDCVNHGINVIVTAHAIMRKVEQPDERGAYDHWGLKLSKHTGPLLKEWCDSLLFANYKTYVEVDGGKAKASGGKRKLFTCHTPYWDAKNRHGLDEECDMDYKVIAPMFMTEGKPEREPSELIKELGRRMTAEGIRPERVKQLVSKKKLEKDGTAISEYSDATAGYIIDNWDKAVEWLKKG